MKRLFFRLPSLFYGKYVCQPRQTGKRNRQKTDETGWGKGKKGKYNPMCGKPFRPAISLQTRQTGRQREDTTVRGKTEKTAPFKTTLTRPRPDHPDQPISSGLFQLIRLCPLPVRKEAPHKKTADRKTGGP